MVYILRSTQTSLTFLLRIAVAVVLVFALLSSIVPFNSAAAGHLCTMECCAGLAPHAAGSCHMDMKSMGGVKPEPRSSPAADKLCGLSNANQDLKDRISAGVMGMKSNTASSLDLDNVTIDASDQSTGNSSDHYAINSQSDAKTETENTTSRGDSSHSAVLAAQSFSKPCPPECGPGVASSNVRPSRPTAVLARGVRPLPPAKAGKYRNSKLEFLIASACGEQLRPRGPPVSLS